MYDEVRSTFKFEYDARPEADEDDKNRWVELINIATTNPNIIPAMQMAGWEFNIGEAFKKVIAASGAGDWDKVLTQVDPEQMGQDPMMDPTMDPAMQSDGEDEELAQTMEQYGLPEEAAVAVMEARRQGFSEEEIVNYLRQGATQ